MLREKGLSMRYVLLTTVSILGVLSFGPATAHPNHGLTMAMQEPSTAASPPSVQISSQRIAGTPIRIGQTLSGTIGPEDPKLSSDNSSYEVYDVRVPAGQRVTATLSSAAFQPVLSLGTNVRGDCEDCVGGSGEVNTKPAIVSRLMTSGGLVEIRVNTMNAGEAGPFTLNVTAATPAPLTNQALTYGQSRTGALTTSDAVTGDENTLTDAYAIRLTAGQQVQVDLFSSDFDPKLELFDPNGEKVEEDDDSGPGNAARIRFTAPRAGTYQIRAMPLSEGGLGAYTLRAGARPAVLPLPAPRPLVLGTALAGAITNTTPTYENDGEETRALRYSFNAIAGQVYRISATKRAGSELDPRISVGKLVNNVIANPETDDDGGGELNAVLRYRAATAGVHAVEVNAVGETLGAFDIKVVQSPPDRAPGPPIAMTLGTSYSGNLVDGGPRRSDETLFDGYSIALKRGDRVTFHMMKPDDSSLDPKLEIGKGSVAAFEQIAEDDDGGPDLNARLRFVAPDDGTYIIRATTVTPANEGAYVVKVETPPLPVLLPNPTPIQVGLQASGTLANTDPLLNDQTFYDRYLLDAQVGDTFEISVDAANFDVIVGARSRLREDDDYQTDDDSGGGTNAKLTYTVTTAGPQVIRVTSLGEEAVGAYTISVVKK